MPVNALRKDQPRPTRPAPRTTRVEGAAPPLSEAAQQEADLANQEQEALWEAADNAMTQQDGSLRW
ncbi:MAG: hypothetical protein GKS05_05120 [Nitrospirales bacterium]|nr:hypothetical protein [Nitrospirales bacterium]NKB81263.1 hypothetical protein [Nitrospirales bacterium]